MRRAWKALRQLVAWGLELAAFILIAGVLLLIWLHGMVTGREMWDVAK